LTNAATPQAASGESGSDLILHWTQIWFADCNEFRRWERDELILKEPSPNMLIEHRKRSQMFILSARLLQGLMANPDYPARDFRAEVDGKVRQLEETWDMIHNPMTSEEAELVLQKAFPDGFRTGGSA
jgi:hypothetical protein